MRRTGWHEATERARALAAEATAITSTGAPPDVAWLAGAAGWLAEVAPRWEELTGRAATERAYRPLAHVPALEIWLICWPRRGRLQLHDHGGACGAFEVVDGLLDERFLQGRPRPDGALTATGATSRDRIIGPGQTVAFDGGYIHDVRNSAATVATSVHIYGPAERPMAFYRVDGGLVRTVGLGEQRSLVRAEAEAEANGVALGPEMAPATGPGPR